MKNDILIISYLLKKLGSKLFIAVIRYYIFFSSFIVAFRRNNFSMKAKTKLKIFGQDLDLLIAVFSNILSWFISTFFPFLLPKLLPLCESEEHNPNENNCNTKCVSIGRPGGLEQLRVVHLKAGVATIGYNVRHFHPPPFVQLKNNANLIPSDCVVVHNEFFSVNYADCTIRWGLYESAKNFVGWPIVPGKFICVF